MKNPTDVRNDYIDDQNFCHIDCYFTDDDNEQGVTVAIVDMDSKKVYFIDNMFRSDKMVMDAIEDAKNRAMPEEPESTEYSENLEISSVFTSGTKDGLDDQMREFIENHDVIDWPNVTIVTEIVKDETHEGGYHWRATLVPKPTDSALKELLVEEHGVVDLFWNKEDIIELAAQDNRRELLPSEVDEIARQLANNNCEYGISWDAIREITMAVCPDAISMDREDSIEDESDDYVDLKKMATTNQSNQSKMNYKEIESQLIANGEQYRQSPGADITAFYDGTPYVKIGDGIKARAIFHNGNWVFVAMFVYRQDHKSSLSENLKSAIAEIQEQKRKWDEDFAKKMPERSLND